MPHETRKSNASQSLSYLIHHFDFISSKFIFNFVLHLPQDFHGFIIIIIIIIIIIKYA